MTTRKPKRIFSSRAYKCTCTDRDGRTTITVRMGKTWHSAYWYDSIEEYHFLPDKQYFLHDGHLPGYRPIINAQQAESLIKEQYMEVSEITWPQETNKKK